MGHRRYRRRAGRAWELAVEPRPHPASQQQPTFRAQCKSRSFPPACQCQANQAPPPSPPPRVAPPTLEGSCRPLFGAPSYPPRSPASPPGAPAATWGGVPACAQGFQEAPVIVNTTLSIPRHTINLPMS